VPTPTHTEEHKMSFNEAAPLRARKGSRPGSRK